MQQADQILQKLNGMLNGIASIKMRPSAIGIEGPSANAGEQYETNLEGVAKFSFENKSATTAYLEFSQGSYTNLVDVPNGETREFVAPTGFTFTGKMYINWGAKAAGSGNGLLIKFTPQ